MPEIEIQKISPYIRYVNNIEYPKGAQVGPRIIYDHEFIYCMEGSADFVDAGRAYHLEKGGLMYHRPYIQNTMIIPKGGYFHAHCVHFDWVIPEDSSNFAAQEVYLQKASREVLRRLEPRPNYEISESYLQTLTEGLPYPAASGLMQQMYQSFIRQDVFSPLQTRVCFLELMTLILQNRMSSQGTQRKHENKETVDLAVEYLRQNFGAAITVPQLAARFDFSPKYFGSMFKTVTGMPLQKYLLDIRIGEAKSLLLHSHMTLQEIAERCGFSDAFYFNRQFKAREGITPGRYRRTLKISRG